MARRDRVPRHKSHSRKRNKNAKLSPFQREQKRAKLANQVPTARTIGGLDSVPHSQRHVFDYLQERAQRQKEKRAALEFARQREKEEAAENTKTSNVGNSSCTLTEPSTQQHTAECVSQKTKMPTTPDHTENTPAVLPPSISKKKKMKKAKMVYPSLNEELTESVGAAVLPLHQHTKDSAATSKEATAADPNARRSVDEIIARKKERKHKRKQEARRARVAAQLEDMEAELDDYVKANSAAKRSRAKRGEDGENFSKRDRVNVTFERQLRIMEKDAVKKAERQRELVEEANQKKVSGVRSRKRHRDGVHANGEDAMQCKSVEEENGDHRNKSTTTTTEEPPQQRKRISFDPKVGDPAAAQSARSDTIKKKPQDFYELVDVVRYGERVEAPPVFDVVPNHHTAVSRLANQLEREMKGFRARRAGVDERHRLLSGGGQLGERKRLARLGLAPAITHTVRADRFGVTTGAPSSASRMSKEEEIKALRNRVIATYQRNRRKEVTARKGVDMRHEFPKFA